MNVMRRSIVPSPKLFLLEVFCYLECLTMHIFYPFVSRQTHGIQSTDLFFFFNASNASHRPSSDRASLSLACPSIYSPPPQDYRVHDSSLIRHRSPGRSGRRIFYHHQVCSQQAKRWSHWMESACWRMCDWLVVTAKAARS